METILDTFGDFTGLMEETIDGLRSYRMAGRVVDAVGTLIRAEVPSSFIGELCLIKDSSGGTIVEAEVVALCRGGVMLTPLGRIEGVRSDSIVEPTGRKQSVPVGDSLIGRILDGRGSPIDTAVNGPLVTEKVYPLYADPPNPLSRKLINRPIGLGVRAIDGLLTCGEGQRMGIFAAAGGGKSTLLSMIVNSAEVDVVVVALIGERGREVREFVENHLGAFGRSRSVVVVATSDRPAMERIRAAYCATAIAEYFRDQGKSVLLIMDSVTRFARAQREIGLSAGEPPTRRGFPPSVFSALPMLMERAGPAPVGSITALYSVLVEGDDMTEPVADETRSILDGHIVLSRKLASLGHYPAIDIPASVSRVMNNVVDPRHTHAAEKVRSMLARYSEVEMLIQLGEYKPGSDPKADEAIKKIGRIREYLCQGTNEKVPFMSALKGLAEITV